MPVGYRIGTYAGAVPGLAYLEDLGLGVVPFPSPFQPWSTIYDVGNGQTYGDGFPVVEWHFQVLTMTEMAVLLGFVGSGNQSTQVSISTKNDLDEWDDYAAYMHRPNYPRQGSRRPGRYWRQVTFRFTQLQRWLLL